jgi:hypothetical protein
MRWQMLVVMAGMCSTGVAAAGAGHSQTSMLKELMGKIKHVIVLMEENRHVHSLIRAFWCCAPRKQRVCARSAGIVHDL